jgi:hypothetical protein
MLCLEIVEEGHLSVVIVNYATGISFEVRNIVIGNTVTDCAVWE